MIQQKTENLTKSYDEKSEVVIKSVIRLEFFPIYIDKTHETIYYPK